MTEGRPRSRKLWAWRSEKDFLLLAFSPAAYCPGHVTSPLAVLPAHRGVRGPFSFAGHSEASLINICEASKTFLHWRYRFCERLLASLLRNMKVGLVFGALTHLGTCETPLYSLHIWDHWMGRFIAFFFGTVGGRANGESVSEVLNIENKLGGWTVACKLEARFLTVPFSGARSTTAICYPQRSAAATVIETDCSLQKTPSSSAFTAREG